MRKKTKRIIKIVIIVVLLFYFIPIPIKKAIRIDVDTADSVTDFNTLVGKQVTLLCEPCFEDDLTKKVELFEVIAIGDENGNFKASPSILIYVHPCSFIGHAIKRYNCGFRNRFVFNGELQSIDRGKKYYVTQYHIDLSFWDVVYPVYHHQMNPLSDTEFYQNHLFFFDYFKYRPAAYS